MSDSDSRAAEELERAAVSIERAARKERRKTTVRYPSEYSAPDRNWHADVAWGMETAAAMLRARARRLRKGKR